MKNRNNRKKISITYTKERVVLSDVLPYETPLTFSNRHFYQYLIKREKCLKNSQYKKTHNKAFSKIEDILFGTKNISKDVTNPFIFNISHKENDFRALNIIHPYNQLKVLEFYEKNQSLIWVKPKFCV